MKRAVRTRRMNRTKKAIPKKTANNVRQRAVIEKKDRSGSKYAVALFYVYGFRARTVLFHLFFKIRLYSDAKIRKPHPMRRKTHPEENDGKQENLQTI
ncbi:MAG: hypothetical protein II682_05910, partial [Firmicutes bacterium]|nr:hypothetical protein [Bacillota bacterium]